MDEDTDEPFEALLRYVRDERGFDFTGYKRASLMRRVRYRMSHAGYETFSEYLDFLQANADEFAALFDAVLINVTAFFRDPKSWEYLKADVIPRLMAERGPDAPIRAWSAGCASGQEAYTLAMLLAEALGVDEFRNRVKIYATDVDEAALTEARAASYDATAVESVPAEHLAAYFEESNGQYIFRNDLRRCVIFGRNDLVKDAPISRVDLLVCRNTLMYLNAETQRSVLGRLHFALAPQGFLFLGHAEMLLSHGDRFTPLNMAHRVFRKAIGSQPGLPRYDPATAAMYVGNDGPGGLATVRDAAFRASPVAQVVVTGEDTVALINQQAETMLGLSSRDVGRFLRDLEVSYRPVELRAYLEEAKQERRPSRIRDVSWQRSGTDTTWLDVHVTPLVGDDDALLGVSIEFFDTTATRNLLDQVVETNRQLEAAYEELQSTNEELETTNEELQSTVEELETTNEELQSTNEELETMNEELQSTNDELNTINDALGASSTELVETRAFFASLVNSVHQGLLVVDREMRVTVWNRGCEQLWGVRADEAIGHVVTGLDIGLPMADIRPLIGRAFVDPETPGITVVSAVNRRGRDTRIRVTCTGFRSPTANSIDGALLLLEADPDQ